MEGHQKNTWSVLRGTSVNKEVDAPVDNYPKGKAKYTRVEPDAAFDRQHNAYGFNHHERRYKPSITSERESFQYS